jgi:hypothetical protein
LGYKVFTHGQYNLNLIGVRSSNPKPETADDWITCWYKDSNDCWQSHWWKASTDPSQYWLKHPMRVEGTAVVVEGQYPGLWRVGTHKGYKAFQQVGKVKVYRDGDLDNELDFDPETIQEGLFYINGHAMESDPWDEHDIERDALGKWTAGCQVWANPPEFRQAITLAEQSKALGFGNTVTYTLVNARRIWRLCA